VILADTDVLIDFLAGIEPIVRQASAYAAAERLQTTAITCFELLSGAREGRRGERVRKLVATLPVVPLDRKAGRSSPASRARRRNHRNGRQPHRRDRARESTPAFHAQPQTL